jgi:ferric reductase like protein
MTIAAAHGPSALWYVTRGTGAVTLVLLTASVVLGILELRAWRPVGVSLFAVASLHRTFSLLAVALLAVHVTTTLLDPFPHIGVLTAFVPFVTSYRPLWVGLGTIASDLLLAIVVTSLVRRRLGFRAWRGVHWFAYLCWPVALLHGFGTGSDPKTGWMLVLTSVCTGAVLLAVAGRISAAGIPARVRLGATGTAALAAVALAIWLVQGPLAKGWAGRAGTPASVLAAFNPRAAAPPAGVHPSRVGPLEQPFSASLRGVIRRGQSAGGTAIVDLRMRFTSGPAARLRVRLGGQALSGGGLVMKRSSVTFGPPGAPRRYRGRVQTLQNSDLRTLVGTAHGRALKLVIRLALNGNSVRGAVQGTPVAASAG